MRAAMALAVAASCTALPMAAQADGGPWLVRLRAVQLDSANKDSTGLALTINDKLIPEVDISYFFTPQIAAELILTYPQKQTVHSGVTGTDVGSFKHLPPTLTLQYHFTGLGAIKPYVGAGVNYTRISNVDFGPVSSLGVSLDRNSVGPALQVGADFELAKNLYLNLDLKKVQIRTDVKSFGQKVGEFKVDPLLIGIGIGRRF
jgi:outer membrane protein